MANKVYIISYSFREKKGDYTNLYEELSNFDSWWHKMDNTWFISTELSEKEVLEKIKPHLDKNIYLFVSEVNKSLKGWLPTSGWDWLKKYLK